MIPAYIDARLRELAALERGWYGHDGIPGEPISAATIERARARFDEYEGERVYLYPTIEGHISAEWADEADETIAAFPAPAAAATREEQSK